MTESTSGSRLIARWVDAHPRASALFQRAVKVFPSGVTHDNRYVEPFPIYVTSASGARKWDVDGHEYVDYFMGHGALLLGHCHPAVTEAVVAQARLGSHYGASHELEIRWGELIQQIVPSAEKLHFFSSGTEATMMAIRLARAYTGRDKIMKIRGHFHGWHDYATIAMEPPYDEPISRGIPKALASTVVAVPPMDLAAMEAAFAADPDIAGVILIAGGCGHDYLAGVNEIAHRHGAVTIYDEVVTGFRYAPGGCQEYYGVTPDMTTLAKILAGGYPGGAVVGKAEIIDILEFRSDPRWQRFGRIRHPGTFNGSPTSAAAGIACLELARTGDPQRQATVTADRIRAELTAGLRRRGVAGDVGGDVSQIGIRLPGAKASADAFKYAFRLAMQLGGVDASGLSLLVSAVHTDADVDVTVSAFDGAIEMLQSEGML